jgi:uncharacterized repeat protein (TIGR03847 family)
VTDSYEHDLDPVTFITVGTEGPPGQRTFYLQGVSGSEVVSLVIEKEQAMALATSIDRLLVSYLRRHPERAADLEAAQSNMDLLGPVDPLFRVSEMGIGIDEERDVFVLVAREVPEDQGGGRGVRFVVAYDQMMALARHAIEIVSQGRPVCPLCGRPMDPEGHFCPRSNGHPPGPS